MSERDFFAEVRRENEAARVLTTEFYGYTTDMALALLDARDAIDSATQRAEAAEAERDDARIEVSLANTQRGVLAAENVALLADRDALREEVVRLTDLATLSGEVFAFAITDAKMPNLETRRQLHDAVKRALDAALAVQPTTEGL
jgi:hypothetical protein